MHESIAAAKYRGYERHIYAFDYNKLSNAFRSLPNKRAARMRAIPKVLERVPTMAVLDVIREGDGPRATLNIIGLEIGSDREIENVGGWYCFLIEYSARDGSAKHFGLPILVTHHLVKRMMQRLKIDDPRRAMKGLRNAVIVALKLRDPLDREVMLPAEGGAVIAVRDKHHPDSWAFVTFVDDAKLSPTQRQSIEYWVGKAATTVHVD